MTIDIENWPFPESAGSPVWQAWRAAGEARRQQANAAWPVLGLRQLLASKPRRTPAAPRSDPEESSGRTLRP
jgi:hypothetical protein